MTIRSIVTALGVALLLMQGAPVFAQPQAKCVAGKTKCMSKKGTGLIKCHQLAETPGKPADPNANGCRDKVVGKFDGGVDPAKGCFEKLENKNPNDCITFNDTPMGEAEVDSCVATFVEAIDPAPITQTKCGAGKKKCVSKYLKALLKCNQLAQTPGKPNDPNANGCVDKAVAKYTGGVDPTKGCFYKLENKSGNDCGPPTGNSLTLQNLVEDCVDDLVTFVDTPNTTTTSSTLSSSTSTSSSLATTSSTSTSSSSSTSSSTSTSSSLATTSSTSSSSSTSTSSSTSSSSSLATTSSSSSSTSSSTSTSTSTPVATTTTTLLFDFLSTTGSGDCGNTFRDLAGTIPLKKLLCGNLSLGGGLSQVPDNATPAGATNRFTLSGCTGTNCNIGPTTSGSTPAGVDCTDIGCKFGVPLPISNAGLSVCVTNTFSPVAPSGTLDIGTGDATWNFQLNSATVLTGLPAAPCPTCRVAVNGAICSGTPGAPCTGVCDGSPNQGAVCTSKNAGGNTSDCPAPAAVAGAGGQRCYRGTNNGAVCNVGGDCPGGVCAQFIGNIAISLNPLTTGTSTLSSATGLFCPGVGQTATQHGAYNSAICRNGPNSGDPCVNLTTAEAADVANCGAGNSCRPGNLTNYCNGGANDGLGCTGAAACPAPGTCVRAGTLVQLIREVGSPATGGLTPGVPKAIKLGSAFCVSATTNPTVNSNANLPASGATSVVGTVTLLP